MPRFDQNPFPTADADRHDIWEILVRRDIAAFVAADGSAMAADIVADGFIGLNAHRSPNPDSWRLSFTFAEYQAEWLRQAHLSASKSYKSDLAEMLFNLTVLRDIDVNGDMAVAHKKFDGIVTLADGSVEALNWQTLYFCRRFATGWKIVGFTGYMPHPMAGSRKD